MKRCACLVGVVLVVLGISTSFGADWPGWRGPDRDGKSKETGLLKQWPDGGPKLLWTAEGLGQGYSTVAVAKGTIYTTGMRKDGTGVLFAFDYDGKPKWNIPYGPEWKQRGHFGTRCTPTVDGDRIYVMSGMGTLICFETKDGKKATKKWSVDTVKKFGGKVIGWGIAESVLIDGKNVICTPGGKGASVVALDKMTGKTVWTSKQWSEASAYCSPILIKRGKQRLIVTMTANHIVGLEAGTGKVVWKQPHETRYHINPISPVYQDGFIYATSGYGTGGQMLELSPDGKSVQQKWTEKKLDCHHGGVVLVDGYVYGTSDRGSKGNWICLELKSGKVMYEKKAIGKGSVAYADGMLYGYGENGIVGLIKASPKAAEVVSSFKVTAGTGNHWAHPVICGGRLYIRHGDALMAYQIKAK